MTLAGRIYLTRVPALDTLIGAVGAVWLLNAAFQAEAWLVAPSAGHNLLETFAKPAAQVPAWLRPLLLGVLHGVQAVGPASVAVVMVTIAIVIALALLTRMALIMVAGFGLIYSLACWVVLNGLGFPYAHGQTDPGVFIAYAITFLFVLAAHASLRNTESDSHRHANALWDYGRLAFGLLWLFDAGLKWLPGFLFHFTNQITSVIPGQPHWIAVWLGFVAAVIGAIGPLPVAIVIALVETAIAISLLTGRGLKIILPFGILYALAVWSTAEAFGGPYTLAGTGVRGNVLGNVIIYVLPFLFLWTRQRQLPPAEPHANAAATSDSSTRANAQGHLSAHVR